MKNALFAYLIAALVFCGLDFIWLTQVTPGFYHAQVGPLLLAQPRVAPAVLFYVLYLVGVVVLCVLPAVPNRAWVRAGLRGALLGVVAYGTYDLTNLATLKNWSEAMTVIDILWGAFATCVAAALSCRFASRRVHRRGRLFTNR